MDPLLSDLTMILLERDQRLQDAGLLARRNPRRTSFEVLRDVKRRREQGRPAA